MRNIVKISGLIVATIFAVALLAGPANAGWSIVKFADDYTIEVANEDGTAALDNEKAEAVALQEESGTLPQIDEFKLLETQRYDG